MNNLFALLVAATIYIGLPTVVIWGWNNWSQQRDLRNFFSLVSFIAFVGACLSGLLAALSVLYVSAAQLTAYDHRWHHLIAAGFVIAAVALMLSFVGIWGRSALRWHAPLCALGMIVLWVVLAAMD